MKEEHQLREQQELKLVRRIDEVIQCQLRGL